VCAWCGRSFPPNGGPTRRRLCAEKPAYSQQTAQAVEGVRMVDIDDTPDEDNN